MDQFTAKEEGKLMSTPISSQTKIVTVQECASKCLALDHCASFNFDYGTTQTCELLAALRHYDEELHKVILLFVCVYIQEFKNII